MNKNKDYLLDELSEALLGLIITIGVAVIAYYALKFIGLKFSDFFGIDKSDYVKIFHDDAYILKEVKPIRDAAFPFIPQTEFWNNLLYRLIAIFYVYGWPLLLTAVLIIGLSVVIGVAPSTITYRFNPHTNTWEEE